MRSQHQQDHDYATPQHTKSDTYGSVCFSNHRSGHDSAKDPVNQITDEQRADEQDGGADGCTCLRALHGIHGQKHGKPAGKQQRNDDSGHPGAQTHGFSEKTAHETDNSGDGDYSQNSNVYFGHVSVSTSVAFVNVNKSARSLRGRMRFEQQ